MSTAHGQRALLQRLETGSALAGPLFDGLLHELGAIRELDRGDRVGAYRIDAEIGRGGMGVVYRATRTDADFDQTVAIKWIQPSHDIGTRLDLFRRERSLLASLDHPNIASLIDGGRTADGALWFAMPHVVGERIDHAVVARQLSTRERVRLIQLVCAAVQFAHERGVIHRDIKPANVLVDDSGFARLIDFGIAVDELVAPTDARWQYTTRAWASPEQLAGITLTTASDIHQLGRLLADVLAVVAAPTAASPATLSSTATSIDNRAPSERPIHLPKDADLAAIVAMATATEVSDRYASARAFADDLQRWLDVRPVLARNGGLRDHILKWIRRHPYSSAMSLLVATSLIALLSITHARVSRERDIARFEAETATATAGFLTDLFAEADPTRNHGRPADAVTMLDAAIARVQGGEFSAQPALQTRLLEHLALATFGMHRLSLARELIDHAVAIDTEPAVSESRARRLNLQANVHYRFGEFQAASAMQLAARASLPTSTTDPTLPFRIDTTRINIDWLRNDLDAAERRARDLLPRISKALGQHELVGNTHMLLSRILQVSGKLPEAIPEMRLGIELMEAADGRDHPAPLTHRAFYGRMLADAGDLDAGLVEADYAIVNLKRVVGADDPRYGQALGQRAGILEARGELAAAYADLETALRINEAAVGLAPIVLEFRFHLASLACKRQRADLALHWREELTKLIPTVHAEQPDRVRELQTKLADWGCS